MKTNQLSFFVSCFVALVLSFIGCKTDAELNPKSVSEVINETKDLSIMKAAVKHAGLDDALKTSQLAVFAPSDAAFKAAGFADANSVTNQSVAKIRAILFYHIFNLKATSATIKDEDSQELKMLNGAVAYLSKNGKGVSVNGTLAPITDLIASNGAVHILDKIIAPPTQTLEQIIKANPNLSLFVEALNRVSLLNPTIAASLSSNANVLTVFAPTNAAFETLGYNSQGIQRANPTILSSILLYHIAQGRYFSTNLTSNTQFKVSGGSYSLLVVKSDATGLVLKGAASASNTNVVATNFMATNGVLHVVDKVLLL
jgi:uncharacterized surface protein with fasciclin (FAS1) repeats